VSSEAERFLGLAAHARGPALLGHVAGGVLPNPLFTGLILGLLVRSAQFVKCPAGDTFLPRLFAHSLLEVEPKLAACLEIAAWRGGTHPLDDALLAAVDTLTVTGTDAAVAALRARTPARVRLLAYGHQVSLGYAAREALTPAHAPALAGRVSTVALAAAGSRARDLAGEFARWGVTRICPPGRMQHPPLTWRHDGRPSLGDLVTWTNQEMPA
jgi:hypothetical protein